MPGVLGNGVSGLAEGVLLGVIETYTNSDLVFWF